MCTLIGTFDVAGWNPNLLFDRDLITKTALPSFISS